MFGPHTWTSFPREVPVNQGASPVTRSLYPSPTAQTCSSFPSVRIPSASSLHQVPPMIVSWSLTTPPLARLAPGSGSMTALLSVPDPPHLFRHGPFCTLFWSPLYTSPFHSGLPGCPRPFRDVPVFPSHSSAGIKPLDTIEPPPFSAHYTFCWPNLFTPLRS